MHYSRNFLYRATIGLSISIKFRLSRDKYIEHAFPKISDNFYKNTTMVVTTYNESDRIEGFLLSIPKSINLLVVDNFSSDDTREKVKKTRPNNTKFIQIKNPGHHDKNTIKKIMENIASEWAIFTIVSERWSHNLLARVDTLISSGDYDSIFIPRKSITNGFVSHLTCELLRLRLRKNKTSFKSKLSYKVLKPEVWDFERSVIHSEFPTKAEALRKHILLPNSDEILVHIRQGDSMTELSKIKNYATFDLKESDHIKIAKQIFSAVIFFIVSCICHLSSFTLTSVALRANVFQSYYRILVAISNIKK